MTKKVIVAHPGQQHSFRLATAIKQRKILYKYVTTVYDRKGSLTRLSKYVLKGEQKSKAGGRKCAFLEDQEVLQLCEMDGLVLLLLQRIAPKSKLCAWWELNLSKKFGIKVAKYAIKQGADMLIVYDTQGFYAGQYLKKKNAKIKLVMDVSAANRGYMKQVYEKDMELVPHFSARMKSENKFLWNEKSMRLYLDEIVYPDAFIVPSYFVARSLQYEGVDPEKIHVCPYGVDVAKFKCKTYEKIGKRPLKFIYVGGIKALKGVAYLLDAFMEIPKEEATLTIVGAYNEHDEDIQKYLNRVNFSGMCLHSQIPELLRKADVFILPSLGEGLSLSTLEASACGLPLIVTENSGVNDRMTEGREGFVIPIQSKRAIIKKIEWFVENPDKIESMGRAAQEMAHRYTWERYYEQAGDIVQEIFEN